MDSTLRLKRGMLCFCLMVCLAVFSSGCGYWKSGYSSTRLEGNVTVAGQPLVEGSIQFIPQGKGQGPTVGGVITDGRYAVDGVPLGSVRAVFNAFCKTKRYPADGVRPERWDTESLIPQKYNGGIVVEVSKDQNEQDFAL